MREIKFRAYYVPEKTWVTWDEWESVCSGYEEPFTSTDDWKVMQYTGIKDGNGKEIYEGDLLEESLYVKWCGSQGGFEAILPENYCMACEGDMQWQEVAENPQDFFVIGNIYDNPELLNDPKA